MGILLPFSIVIRGLKDQDVRRIYSHLVLEAEYSNYNQLLIVVLLYRTRSSAFTYARVFHKIGSSEVVSPGVFCVFTFQTEGVEGSLLHLRLCKTKSCNIFTLKHQ